MEDPLNKGQKAIVCTGHTTSQAKLIHLLEGAQTPAGGRVKYPDAEISFFAWSANYPDDRPLKRILLHRVEKLAKSLRKYEQLSIQMTKHFSPAQLGGYMDELEELENFINTYDGWDLEHAIKEWQDQLELTDLTLTYGEVSESLRKKTELAAFFLYPPVYLVFEDPFPFLDNPQAEFVKNKLRNANFAWLMVTGDPDHAALMDFASKFETAHAEKGR